MKDIAIYSERMGAGLDDETTPLRFHLCLGRGTGTDRSWPERYPPDGASSFRIEPYR